MRDGCLVVDVAAPPADGAANALLLAFLAGLLSQARSDLRLVSGATRRTKLLELEAMDAEGVGLRLGVSVLIDTRRTF